MRDRKNRSEERERGGGWERGRGCSIMSLAGMYYMLTLVGQPAQK